MSPVGATGQVPDRRTVWMPTERPFVASGRTPSRRPNIVFILADDLGWGDLGCFGSLHNATPHIDGLAAEGVRFTHAYSTSSTCSPTRIGLYTGRYPGRLVAGLEEPLGSRTEAHGIPHDHPTLPSILADAAYSTAMIGKWHCGWLPWFSPLRIGFQTFWGNLDGAVDYFAHIDTIGAPDLYEGEVAVEEVGYYTELIARRAAGHISSLPAGEPFYVQVNFTAPHWPWEGPHDQHISERVVAAAERGGPAALKALFHFEGGSLAKYREMVSALDDAVGQVLAALDATGARDDTIVIFSSDNGGERFGFLWPFVGEKGDLEEGGIRVPTIIRWPAVLDARQVSDVPFGTMDLTATLLAAAGTGPHPDYALDGVDLNPWLIDGAEPPQRDLLWRTREQGAIRRGRFKLLVDREAKPLWGTFRDMTGRRVRLFDVADDGREKADLSADHPDLTADLLAAFEAFDAEMLPYPPEPVMRGGVRGFDD